MSKYTMQLRAVERLIGHDELVKWFEQYDIDEYLTREQRELIENRLPYWSKTRLAEKCINRYYMREIGFETPELFKLMLKVRLDEIMQIKLPYLYSMAIKYDPLVNVDYVESYTKNSQGTNTGTSQNKEGTTEGATSTGKTNSTTNNTTTSTNLEVNSDTPQGRINKEELLQGKYATNTSAGESETNSQSTGETTDTNNVDRNIDRNINGSYNQADTKAETFTRSMKGNSGVMTTAQKLIEQYRNIVIAVNKEIIDELDNLFFGILD